MVFVFIVFAKGEKLKACYFIWLQIIEFKVEL